ncbi:MAG TPA: glycosyltransferase family 4 protein [Verrucomicrobiota bacterium]|nr:glycosyltransferase family 4 protein [Verrucomicrobiota bacterium]HNU50690.1 glycosyltransferase family 4 protein [Verrucomicrobiota bacterium]
MKLALVLFEYFPYGGLQRGCALVAEECARRGHRVRVAAGSWEGTPPPGVAVEVLGRQGASNVARDRSFVRRWQAYRAREPVDGVIGFNKLPGLDVYYGSDSCYVERMRRLRPAWYRWTPRYRHFHAWERAVFARGAGTHILMLAEQEIPVYRRLYATEPERFHVLPPGLTCRRETEDDRARMRCDVRARFGWGSEELLLLLVGSGFRTKGLDRAIRGLAALPRELRDRARLVVVGDDSPGRYRWLARGLGIGSRVAFLGGRPSVYEFLVAADLLVHPAYAENTGNVLIEALTAGLPVLASGACGYAGHVVAARAGRIVGTPDAFSQGEFNRAATEMLVSDERTQWRANGLEYARVTDLYSRREKAADVIEAVVSARRQASP